MSRPPDISDFVMSVGLDAVKRRTSRTLTDVFEKLLERREPELDTATTVVLPVLFIVRVATARLSTAIGTVFT